MSTGTLVKGMKNYMINTIFCIGPISPHCVMKNHAQRWEKIPLYKFPDTYRPVALPPCFLKIFEKLLQVLSTIGFPNPQQQGFQPKLDCLKDVWSCDQKS